MDVNSLISAWIWLIIEDFFGQREEIFFSNDAFLARPPNFTTYTGASSSKLSAKPSVLQMGSTGAYRHFQRFALEAPVHSLLSTKEERASTFPGFLISDGNRTLFPFHTFPLAKTCFWKPPGSSSYTSPSEVSNTVSWTLPKCSRLSTAVVCDWNQKLCRPQRAKTTC